MELGMKNKYCVFTVYYNEKKEDQRDDAESMQDAFERFRRRRQEEFRGLTRKKSSIQRHLQDPDAQWQLRMKFLEQAKCYIGVPYAQKYHEPGTPEYESPLFLDCCGFIRRVLRDLREDFGFSIGPGNQAYQYDTLPISLPSEEHLKPGDLVFISGAYFDTQRKGQLHNIVHVEIWLGDGERSLGARWKRGKAQVFDSYKFISSSYGDMEYHFKSIETWLQGICTSHCPEHKWATSRQRPGWRSIFHPKSDQDEPAEEDVGAEDSKCVTSKKEKPVQMFENRMPEDVKVQKQRSNHSLAEGEPTSETKPKVPKTIVKATPRMSQPEEKKPEDVLGSGPFFYIGGANGVDILNLYCKNKGWQRIYDNRREDYLLKWSEIKFRDTYYAFREGEQMLYQIPNNKILTTKIGLLMNLREYERVMRKVNRVAKLLRMEDFFPETFRLDTKDERELFFETYQEPHIWICKPTSSNQGRGIFLLKNQVEVKDLQARLQNIEEDPMYKKLPYRIPPARIVQRYIDRPLLLEGKKFDVRSYLLISCTMPYMLFFGHGYVRLTCIKYDPRSEDLTSHLTNQYVQKKSPLYPHVKEETVWCMDRFNTYVNEKFREIKGLPKDWVFNGFTKRMKEIMLQCFLAVKSKLDCKLGYFDLIGCDFLIDEDFKVWLLEMNSNPALHTNCTALKSIVPMVVNETLDLVIEIFTKIQKGQNILPLESLYHFTLLYNGVASDGGLPQGNRSRTSLRSIRSHSDVGSTGSTNTTSVNNTANTINTSSSRSLDKQPSKALEKAPKGEDARNLTVTLPEGLYLPPSKGVPRDPLPMPQIQISIIPNLSSCPAVKTILRGNQVCNSGSQYIIRHVPETVEADGSDDKGKASPLDVSRGLSKDKSYAAWFQQTFGTKLMLGPSSNGGRGPLTSSQMLSLHLQSDLPPSLPNYQEFPKPYWQLTTYAKKPQDSPKAIAEPPIRSGDDPLAEEKKTSHRGS